MESNSQLLKSIAAQVAITQHSQIILHMSAEQTVMQVNMQLMKHIQMEQRPIITHQLISDFYAKLQETTYVPSKFGDSG
jgi:hypothetical protein